jgi:hypothetical protein
LFSPKNDEPPRYPQGVSWLKRILLGSACLATLAVAVLILLFFRRDLWQYQWLPKDCQADLNSRWPLLQEKDTKAGSAFDLLRRSADAAPKTTGMPEFPRELRRLNLDRWSEAAFPTLTKVLADGERALVLARAAAAAPDPQVPSYTAITDQFPHVIASRRVMDLFRLSAAQKAGNKNLADSVHELETGMAFSRILTRGGVLIHALIDCAFEMQACRDLRLIALQNDLPEPVAQSVIHSLLDGDSKAEPLAETLRAEYRAVPGTVEMIYRGSSPQIFAPKDQESGLSEEKMWRMLSRKGWVFGSTRESTSSNLASVYRCLVSLADQPYDRRSIGQLEKGFIPDIRASRILLANDPVGYVFAKFTIPVFPGIFIRYRMRAAELRATAIVIALRQFERTQGRRATDLNDLVPQYFPSVPLDPFDGHPFRYRVREDGKWIVYSVGPNQLDEGGVETGKSPKRASDPGDLIFCECQPEKDQKRLSDSKGSH